MTKETLDFLHQAYNSVVKSPETFNILDIVVALYSKCLEYNPPKKDEEDFGIFVRNLDSTIRIRSRTFQLTNMVTDIVFLMMYIIIWANETQSLDIDVNIIARRKSLESELNKLLKKDRIRDRFGIRGIELGKDDAISTEKIISFYKILTGILAGNNRSYYTGFHNWVEENCQIDNYTRERLLYILNIPFTVDYIKNYIQRPKPNGYQSIQFTIATEMYSNILPGSEFEIQLRTHRMNQVAENGTASHSKVYKNSEIENVFRIDNFENVSIVGLSSYNSVADDIDGIHYGKVLVNRRISSTLVMT